MTAETETQTANPPVETIRVGSVQASIWANTSEGGNNYLTVTFERRYLDPETQEWRNTRGFRKSDLLALARAAEKAFDATGEIARAARKLSSGY